MNKQLSYFPDDVQKYFFARLKSHWESTFFEMLVARSLHILGATLEFELELLSGSRPDFFAQFADYKVIVEATSPSYYQEMGMDMKRDRDLISLVEKDIPYGWWVGVEELPEITQNMPKRPFRSAVLAIFKTLQDQPNDQFSVESDTEFGSLRLHFVRTSGKGGILHEPFYTFWSSAEETIKNTFKKKRKQVRGGYYPVILAIQAPAVSHDLDDFDIALFGRTSGQPLDSYKPSENLSGAFDLWKTTAPNIDAVLVYFCPGWTGCQDPVLYVNPRSRKILPQVLTQLHQRVLSQDRKWIESILPLQEGIINSNIEFISSSIR